MEFNSDLSSDTMAANLEKDLQENIGFNISTILVQSGYEKTAPYTSTTCWRNPGISLLPVPWAFRRQSLEIRSSHPYWLLLRKVMASAWS